MNGGVEGGAEGVSVVKGAAGWGEGSSNPVGTCQDLVWSHDIPNVPISPQPWVPPPYNTVLYKKHPLQNQTSDFQGKKREKKMKKTAKSVQVSSPICYCYHLAALSHHQYCYLQAYTTFKETVLTWSTLYLNPIHSKHHMET